MKGEKINSPYAPYCKGNPSQVSQSCDAEFAHMHNSSGFYTHFNSAKNIHVKREVTFLGELVTMSKNNLMMDYVIGISLIWGINFITLYSLLRLFTMAAIMFFKLLCKLAMHRMLSDREEVGKKTASSLEIALSQ